MENPQYQKEDRPWLRLSASVRNATPPPQVASLELMYNRKRKDIRLRPQDYLYLCALLPLHGVRVLGVLIFFLLGGLDNLLLILGIRLPLFRSLRFQKLRIFLQLGLVIVHKTRISAEQRENLDFIINHSNIFDNALTGYIACYARGKVLAAYYETLKWNHMYFGVRDDDVFPMRGLRLAKGKSFSFHNDVRQQDIVQLMRIPRETRLVYAPEGWTKDIRFQKHLWDFHASIPNARKKDLAAISLEYRFLNEHLYDYLFHRLIGNFFIQSLMIQFFTWGVIFSEEDFIPYSKNIELDLKEHYKKMGFVHTGIKIVHKEIPIIEKNLMGY